MPPKKTTSAAQPARGGAKKAVASSKSSSTRGGRTSTGSRPSAGTSTHEIVTIDSDSAPERQVEDEEDEDEDMDSDLEPPVSIPPELLTRVLHEFFEKDGTRITRDANEAVTKYIDVFVREAIARAAAEKQGNFLEVGSCFPFLAQVG